MIRLIAAFDHRLVGHVHRECVQVDPVRLCIFIEFDDRGGVCSGGVAHTGVDGVAGVREGHARSARRTRSMPW
ncbi:hypothetical protein [Amycolatopsis sp.]|uniref:hypothetical protein n=1 Tax=Amycolatopsis sp. TaxID=37632 RepID=UPI00261A6D7D|nr:hypothetical protein [Amycolatopsis sp.]